MLRIALSIAALLTLFSSPAWTAEKAEIGQLIKYVTEDKSPGKRLWTYGFRDAPGVSGFTFIYGGEKYSIILNFYRRNARDEPEVLPPEKLQLMLFHEFGIGKSHKKIMMRDFGLDGVLDRYTVVSEPGFDPQEEDTHVVTPEEQHEFDVLIKDVLFFYRLMDKP